MLRKISEIGQKKTSILWLHLYEVLRVAKIIETECRMVVSRGWEDREMGNYCSMGTKFLHYKERVMKMVDSDGCTTLVMYLTLNCTSEDS